MLPLTRSRNRSRFFGTPFSPSTLFQGGTVAGAWYDPSDLSTMFDTSAGTTPVAMPGQGAAVPVGLMLDKSQGLVLGPELVTNGTFVSNVNGWTLTIQTGGTGTFTWDAGKGRLTVVGTFIHQVNQGISVTAGKWYKITGERFLISGAVTSSVSIRDTTDPVTSVVLGGAVVNAGASSDSFSLYYLATSTTTVYLAFRNGNNGAITDIDNISVRELPGNHAIAFNNTTARPELRARVNLLTYSEEFDNGAWSKNNASITNNAAVAPNGTTTADKLVENTANAEHLVFQTCASGSYVVSVFAKAAERSWLRIADTSGQRVWYDLSNGTLGTVSGASSPSISDAGNGWYRCAYVTTTVTNVSFLVANGNNVNNYTGDGTSGIYIWGADLRPANIGANVPAYQRIADANTYDTSGFPLYLRFDGTDDSMYTPANLNLSGTDKVAVFAGVRKLSDAAAGFVAELSDNRNNNAGSWAMTAPATAAANYVAVFRGSLNPVNVTPAATFAAPISNVLTGVGNIAADTNQLRVNGSAFTTSTDDLGTGNFGTYPLYIGARNNASSWLNGQLYSLIIAGSAVSAGNISATEQWVAQKTGLALP